MNINKKIERLEKKILEYHEKLRIMAESYDPIAQSRDDLNEADKRKYDRYNEVIRKLNDQLDILQEQARAQAQGGLAFAGSGKKKALIALVSIVVAGVLVYGEYLYFNNKVLNNDDDQDLQGTMDSSKDTQSGQSTDDTLGSNGQSSVEDAEASLTDNPFVFPSLDGVFGDKGTTNSANNNNNNNNAVETPGSYDNPQEKKGLFDTVLTDIYNEEQVYARAEEIKTKYYDVYLPQQYVTIDEIAEQIRQIGAGNCENVSVDSATYAINTINNLMFREEGNATDRVNGVTTERTETPGTLDLGIFCVDGTKGQMLLHQLSELRTGMIQGAGKEDISALQKQYAELFLSSALLQGYSSIDLNSLETGGMKYLTSIAFLNGATLCGEAKALMIYDPISCEERSFYDITNEFNYAVCTVNMISENGEKTDEVEDLNIMGSYLVQMVSDNYNSKAMYEDDFGRKLK